MILYSLRSGCALGARQRGHVTRGLVQVVELHPANDLNLAVLIFCQRGARFHPVATVVVRDIVDGPGFRVVNVATDDAIKPATPTLVNQRILEGLDNVDCRLDVLLGERRQRPVAHTE